MLVVGLTGGIGSGKSTVADLLRVRGATVIDADAVAREVVEPGQPALVELVQRFGDDVVDDDGRLRRRELAERAFADDDAHASLERITHPHISRRVEQRLADLSAEADPATLVVVDHPLLIETGQTQRFAALLVVLADEQIRVDRVCRQRGLTPDEVCARMARQVDDAQRRAAASHVIENSGNLADLEVRVDEVHAELLELARQPGRA
ncbi:MAG: dephospho-CoA kinase [Nitriliruptoraceae bacterium]